MEELIKRIIPVFLIIAAGFILRRKNILGQGATDVLKKLIVTLFLPSSLFYAFLKADLSASYVGLFLIVFAACFLLFGAGALLRRAGLLDSIYGAEFFTGFEFGMVGIALFSAIFGMESLPVIALIGLGHEFFIWFVYLPFLKSHADDSDNSFRAILASFARSPIIIAIIAAIILNKLSLAQAAEENFITGGILTAMSWFSSVTVSLVLLVLGASLRFENPDMPRSIKFAALRLTAVAAVAIPLFFLIRNLFPGLPPLFTFAWLTFFLLPPPYIIPIYVPKQHGDENSFLSNTIVLYTLMSLALYVIILMISRPAI